MAEPARAERRLLAEAFEQLTALVESLYRFRAAAEAEIAASGDNPNLVRLLRIQLRRIDGLLGFLDDEADVRLRDALDRMHVVQEAREGRFN